MSTRTFVAVDLVPVVRKALREADRAGAALRGKFRWVDDAQRHVTLKFLGDVADEDLPEVCRIVGQVAAEVEPFEIEVLGVKCIPPAGRRLRMIWAEVVDPTGNLLRLHDRLNKAMTDLKVPYEKRPFSGHVTLARVKFCRDAQAVRDRLAGMVETSFGRQEVKDLTVYASRLRPGDPEYTVIARAPLGG